MENIELIFLITKPSAITMPIKKGTPLVFSAKLVGSHGGRKLFDPIG
jgi:hypothetical protein